MRGFATRLPREASNCTGPSDELALRIKHKMLCEQKARLTDGRVDLTSLDGEAKCSGIDAEPVSRFGQIDQSL